MKHEDVSVASIGELVDVLSVQDVGSLTWFRGQARKDWKLLPSIVRGEGLLDAEATMIKRFKQSAAPYLPIRPSIGDNGEWEWIFLMQHHRAPTRLLDWTESPLVGLYFALENEAHDDSDAALWCLDPIELNRIAGHGRKFEKDILSFGIDEQLNNYLPDKSRSDVAVLNPVAGIGPRNSARMVAQSGTFTVIHSQSIAIEDIGQCSHVWRIVIDADKKEEIRKQLKLINIKELSLFPDLDRVAASLKEFV